MKGHAYYIYILTNPGKTVLYIGFTGNLSVRLKQHFENRGTTKSFAGRNYAYKLVYYEVFQYVNNAIAREKQLKRWSRAKKETLINQSNPEWLALNREFLIED